MQRKSFVLLDSAGLNGKDEKEKMKNDRKENGIRYA